MADFAHKQALPPDFRLGSYRVVRVLGVGGFGVTYLGKHSRLGHQAALKEYLPNEFAVREGATVHPKSPSDRDAFEWGLARFVDEARTLTRFRHPNLVRVSDYFEANNTAYIVMDYEDGEPLDVLLERHGTLTEAQLRRVVLPVADGLRQVHAAGFLHRDLKPSNIFVRRADESPVLLDFGAARQALSGRSKSMTTIASAGYSPPEQYESDGEHGPWTDIYALSALCRRAITGKTPLESTTRLNRMLRTKSDPLPDLVGAGAPGYSRHFLAAVDKGLRLSEQERPQNIADWISLAKGRPSKVKEKAAKDATASRTMSDKPRKDGFFWKLARGEFGLAKTYWLFDILVFVLMTAVFVSVSTYAKAVPLYPPAWFSVVQAIAAALSVLQTPYTFLAALGVWRAGRSYQGFRLWAILARLHVGLKALMFTMWIWLDLQSPNPQTYVTMGVAWPVLAMAAVAWIGWGLMRRKQLHY